MQIIDFRIDNGELRNLAQDKCFVLGYEFGTIMFLINMDIEFYAIIHADNRERIEEFLKQTNRPYELQWMKEDRSENWVQLFVPGPEPG